MSEREEFIAFVSSEFDKRKKLFLEKQHQYGGDDPLINFKVGALLRYQSESYQAMFDTALDYMDKHVAHVYYHGIEGEKVDESLGDIAVYCILMLYMCEKNKKK